MISRGRLCRFDLLNQLRSFTRWTKRWPEISERSVRTAHSPCPRRVIKTCFSVFRVEKAPSDLIEIPHLSIGHPYFDECTESGAFEDELVKGGRSVGRVLPKRTHRTMSARLRCGCENPSVAMTVHRDDQLRCQSKSD